MTNAITSFQSWGEHSFLSNFYASPLVGLAADDEPLFFATAEHRFQAAKTLYPEEQKAVAAAATPGQAKRMGRKVSLRPDWEAVKYDVMRQTIAAKFMPDTDLAEMLLDTGDVFLSEGNTWGDRVWGQVNGSGANWLGIILMGRRSELRYLAGDRK